MKDSAGDRIFYTINYSLLSVAGLLCLLPLMHIVSLAFSDSSAVMAGKVSILPVGISLEAFKLLFSGSNILHAMRNSLIVTLVGVALSMSFTIMAAYPLSRRYFFGRRFFSLAIVFTMLFNGGLIPTFLVMNALHLVNSYGALWLLGLINTYNMLVMRSFFENVPEELVEASRIDGCSEWRLLFAVMLPLSLPMLATLTLFYGVEYWNSFFNVVIYINKSDKLTLQVLVQQMIQSQKLLSEINTLNPDDVAMATPEGIKGAGIVVMITPMLLVYPFLQKYFVKGVMIGAIKG